MSVSQETGETGVASFNLIDDPWIPVIHRDGYSWRMGIRETLLQAHGLREIAALPTETVGITRVLLVILHRIFGPASSADWQAIWERESFDGGPINAYLDKCYSKFDLFDPERPVFQTPAIPVQQMPVFRLAHERSTKTDNTLFDKRFDAHEDVMPADAMARAIVGFLPFAPGGLLTSDDGPVDSGAAGPLVNAVVSLVRGKALFHTLLLNLVLYDSVAELPFAARAEDRPLWEREDLPKLQSREPSGYLDWLTYPTRRIKLGPAELSNGTWGVRHVAILDGERLSPNGSPSFYEQHVPFDKITTGWKSVRYSRSGLAWRDRLSLMQATRRPDANHRHAVIDHLAALRRDGVTGLPELVEVDVVGFAVNRKAKEGWAHDRFSFPAVYLDDPELFDRLSGAVALAKEAAKLLSRAGTNDPLGILAAGIVRSKSLKPGAVVGTATLEGLFWNDLAPAFDELLAHLPERGRGALLNWLDTVSRTANRIFDAACDQFRGTGAGIAAEARARPIFDRKLGRVIRGYQREYGLIGESTS